MNSFIYTYKLAKVFNRNLYYCNKKKKYFYLGHCIPDKCCEIIKRNYYNPIEEILLNQIKSK